jgi:uncharacterized protein with GYD domain
MPFFMHQWTYKDPEVKAMVQRPQDRAETVRDAIEVFGGKLHSFFFCFGDYDGMCITEFPDNKTALASLMSIVGSGGLSTIKTTVLVTQEEAKAAMMLAHDLVAPYTPPSGMT